MRTSFAALFAHLACSADTGLLLTDADAHKSWSNFKSKFGKKYAGDDGARFAIFKQNVAYIMAHNTKADSYQLGVNAFTDLSWDEFARHRLGHKMPTGSVTTPALGRHDYGGEILAESVDWVSRGAVTPVKNQGDCGSCWTFSTTGLLEGAWQIAGAPLVSMSESQFVNCDSQDHGCHGGNVQQALEYATGTEVCTESSFPYNGVDPESGCRASACSEAIPRGGVLGSRTVASNDNAFMSALSLWGPLAAAVDVGQDFQLYRAGVFGGSCGTALNHAILIVGYGTDPVGGEHWLVKNSWGEGWGINGYMRLARGGGVNGTCGILMQGVFAEVNLDIAPNFTTAPPGQWVQTYDASQYVSILSKFTLGSDFPSPGADPALQHNFVVKAMTFPIAVIAIGLAAALSAFMRMCCCAPARQPSKRPTVRQTCAFTVLAMVLVTAGVVLFRFTGMKFFESARDEIDLGIADFDQAKELGNNLKASGQSILSNLATLKTTCPNVDLIVGNIDESLQTSLGAMNNFTMQVNNVAAKLDDLKVQYDSVFPLVIGGLAIPTGVTLVLCILMLLMTLTTRFACGLGCTLCADCFLVRLSSIFVVITIIVVAAFASLQLGAAIVASSFCENADSNVVDYAVSYVNNLQVVELLGYYIQGQNSNPIQLQLETISGQLSSVAANITVYGQLFDLYCPPTFNKSTLTDVVGGLNATAQLVDQGVALVGAEQIYPYYTALVHEDLCGNVIEGLGILVILQVMVGLCVLPAVAEASTTFIWRWKQWQQMEKDQAEANTALLQ